jgi:hypothetical protein
MLSVVIPNYNHGSLLRRAVESCFIDRLKPCKVIIFDDGSTDDSRSVIQDLRRDFPSYVETVFLHKNQGLAFVLNKSLDHITTEFVAYRAADDVFLKGFFDSSVAAFEHHSSAGLTIGDVGYFTEDPSDLVVEKLGFSATAGYIDPYTLVNNWPEHTLLHGFTIMYRTDALREVGGFPVNLFEFSDLLATLAVAQRYGLIYIPRVLAGAFLSHTTYGNRSKNQTIHIERICEACLEHVRGLGSGFSEFTARTQWYTVLGQGFNCLSHIQATSAGYTPPTSGCKDSSVCHVGRLDRGAPRAYGVSGVILDRLSKVSDSIRRLSERNELRTIVVFGIGGHTQDLINCWEYLDLPFISYFYQTEEPTQSYLIVAGRQVPIFWGEQFLNNEVDLLIFSSKSFESQMIMASQHIFGSIRFGLSFWGRFHEHDGMRGLNSL